MGIATSVIELNGKRYNAMTGKLLGDAPMPPAVAGRAVDGFVRTAGTTAARHAPAASIRPKAQAAVPAHTLAPVPALRTPAHPASPTSVAGSSAKKAFDIHRAPVRHVAARQPQHAKTLMRSAVRPPELSLKRRTKAVARADAPLKLPHLDITRKRSAAAVDASRLQRARHIARSRLISRFGGLQLPAAPTVAATPRPAAVPASPARPAAPAHIGPTSQPSMDIFERALAQANSHKQPPVPARHHAKRSHHGRRILSIAASSLAILLIVGFITYQNAASIQVHIASSRAGVNATLPAWQPDGFSFGKIAYSPGTVTVDFQGVARGFSIAQTASAWNSSALLNNFVYPNNNTYDTLQSGNSTIYTYGDNNATWVNAGVWYKLTSNGSLSTSQIVRIATSM